MDQPEVATDEWARTRGMRRVRAALQSALLFPALSSFCQLSVHQRELIHGLDGPAVFVSNHVSALDAVVMAEALSPPHRHPSVVLGAAHSIFTRECEGPLPPLTGDS